MKINQSYALRIVVLITLMVNLTLLSSKIKADTGTCGSVTVTLPFNDVMASGFFCQIASAYFSGLTNGTGDGTTYSPGNVVTREQMAAFITRTMDQSLKRGGERTLDKKWFTPQSANRLTLTNVGDSPQLVEFDGTDLWVANSISGTVQRINPSDGKVLVDGMVPAIWTGATKAYGMVCALGKIFVIGQTQPTGNLYMIDPAQPPGAVTTLTTNLGFEPYGIAFDGERIWTGNVGSVSIVTLNPTAVTTVTAGFGAPSGILYDGSHIWTADFNAGTLLKLNTDGSIAQTITVGSNPNFPVFDGTNIWVPNQFSNSVTVVRVKNAVGNPLDNPFVLATLTLNGLNNPFTAAFDGERILVTNLNGNSVSLWKAADLTPLGTFATGAGTFPTGACSDGLNFWITLNATDKLARF